MSGLTSEYTKRTSASRQFACEQDNKIKPSVTPPIWSIIDCYVVPLKITSAKIRLISSWQLLHWYERLSPSWGINTQRLNDWQALEKWKTRTGTTSPQQPTAAWAQDSRRVVNRDRDSDGKKKYLRNSLSTPLCVPPGTLSLCCFPHNLNPHFCLSCKHNYRHH